MGAGQGQSRSNFLIMRNRATKQSAVSFIREAMAQGWKRSVETIRDISGQPWPRTVKASYTDRSAGILQTTGHQSAFALTNFKTEFSGI